ncbi:MAG: alcohol dehydrogenase catalytic domain-containing protein [Dehalococcoidia bacterium]|nr:alcohol dehydrogenase catalytic domain-containing protein [Dehalococcoidia bacterium]
MARKALSAVLEKPGSIVVREFDVPEVGPEEGLLKVEMVGVCGTDPKYYHGKLPVPYPIILGHEILGRIAEIGEVAAKRYGVAKGDRVVVESSTTCGHCRYCLIGSYRLCENKRSYGINVTSTTPPHLWGAYGEYMHLTPGSIIHRISETVPAEAAVLINAVIANGIQWVRNLGGASIGQAVVIQGLGPQGLAMTLAAKESGAYPIIVTGLSADQDRFELAQEFGADHYINVQEEDVVARVREITKGQMADIAVDVTGSSDAILKSLDMVRKQGTLVCAGLTGTGTVTPLPMDRIVLNEIRVQGVFSKGVDAVASAVKLVESRRYPLESMVTHKFPLKEAEQAVQAVGGEVPGVRPIKAVLIP